MPLVQTFNSPAQSIFGFAQTMKLLMKGIVFVGVSIATLSQVWRATAMKSAARKNHRQFRPIGLMLLHHAFLATLFCSVFVTRCTAKQPSPARPNFLWLTWEDASPHLGCYGDAYARTPVLDRLAARSILYRNAFTTSGACTPSRTCLFT